MTRSWRQTEKLSQIKGDIITLALWECNSHVLIPCILKSPFALRPCFPWAAPSHWQWQACSEDLPQVLLNLSYSAWLRGVYPLLLPSVQCQTYIEVWKYLQVDSHLGICFLDAPQLYSHKCNVLSLDWLLVQKTDISVIIDRNWIL